MRGLLGELTESSFESVESFGRDVMSCESGQKCSGARHSITRQSEIHSQLSVESREEEGRSNVGE